MEQLPAAPAQDTGRQIGLGDLGRMVQERRLLIVAFVVGAAVLGMVSSYLMPESFDASTVFLLKERSFLSQLYGPAFIQIPFKNNLANIRDDILSFAHLDRVGRSMGLDAGKGAQEWEDLVRSMRDNITIDVRSQKFADDVITVMYSDGDANRCYRFLNRLRDSYIESNVAGYQEEIRKLMDRYRGQIKRLEAQRAATRKAMTKFMQSHQSEVKGGAQRNVAQLDQKQRKVEDLDVQTAALEDEVKDLEEELAKQSPRVEIEYKERNPEFERLRAEGLKLRKKIQEMETKYTELHPDMIEARAQFERMQKETEGVEEFIKTRVEIKDNERYYTIKGKIRETQRRLQLRKNQKRTLDTEIAVLNNNLRALPGLLEREQELRDRAGEIGGQLAQASGQLRRMEDLWERSKEAGGTVYEIKEQARRPHTPTWPNRPLILGASLGLGLGISLALTYLLEMSRQTFGSVDEASARLGVPVMGAIELIVGPDEVKKKKKRRVLLAVGLAFLMVVSAALAIVYFQFPEALPEPLIDLLERL